MLTKKQSASKSFFLQSQRRLDHDCTFQTLFLDFAAHLIRLTDIAMKKICVRMAATTAEKTRPAVTAFFLIQYM